MLVLAYVNQDNGGSFDGDTAFMLLRLRELTGGTFEAGRVVLVRVLQSIKLEGFKGAGKRGDLQEMGKRKEIFF